MMKTRVYTYMLFFYLSAIAGYGQDELPDNYLPISLKIQDEKLEGKSEYLEGFTFSMDLPSRFLKKPLIKKNYSQSFAIKK